MGKTAFNILHVEDDPGDALLMREALCDGTDNGIFDIVHVDCLKEALNHIKSRGFNAVLLDLGLKDITGIDNVRAIKEEDPDIPIVVLTGVDSDEMAMQALYHGAQEYIIKGHGDGKVIKLAIKSSIERKAVERRLYYEANYDELTGLANRRLFREHFEKILTRAKRWEHKEALMFLDLDSFKKVNDTYGHEAGNLLLKLASDRIQNVLRESDLIARYGGDEFMLLLDDSSDDIRQSCITVANKILSVIKEPYTLNGKNIPLSVSIGIAIFPDCGEDTSSLLNAADKAMYASKASGPNHFCFAE